MSDQKIFAGPKIKRIRLSLNLTQTSMADALEISPSYLNLIERNQRPITVQLLLKLSSVYDISPDQLQGDMDGLFKDLKEVFSDPLLQGELSSFDELYEMSDMSPNVATGILKLHRGYREALTRLSEVNTLLAQKGQMGSIDKTSIPADQLRQLFEEKNHHFEYLDLAAEEFTKRFERKRTLRAYLTDWLFENRRITIQTLPIETMPHWKRRFDRHSMRIFLSERLSSHDQLKELVCEVVNIALADKIDEEITHLGLDTQEAIRLARIELTNYTALAIIMPYTRFLQSAKRAKYDIEVLAGRFNVSFEQAANRLTTLGRKTAKGPDFFLMEVDQAGNNVRRYGRSGFPRQNFGGACPKLLVYGAFSQPNKLLCETVEMSDEKQYLTIAKTIDGPSGAYGIEARKTVLMLGLSASEAKDTIYAPALQASAKEVGTNCRLCERASCMMRSAAPLTRTLALDEAGASISDFNFQN
ncbi:MAG: short-chain fatty acyl-CoA regulator family protein [Nitratireductor sp.]